MRIFEKEQIQGLAELLCEAHGEIERLLSIGEYDHVGELLTDCQSSAIAIGNAIEEKEGRVEIIAVLEEYCEALYDIYSFLGKTDEVCEIKEKADRWKKELQSFGTAICRGIEEQIRVKKEVVFLPYNPAMWDSLESVYMMADTAEDCDAIVIPIPYYDRNPDGTLGKMHYDIDKYPKDIPVIGYEEYDFEKRHPDYIFIHNPYDGANYVTSVHPFFYSKNLKKYTDNLVYIPYFVLNEPNPNDRTSLAAIEGFVKTPAIVHANKVIVQSDKMRRAYINIMSEYAGENTGPLWEKKIAVMESPKLDKARKVRQLTLDIPYEWEKIITRADGSRKKIIFYNTSVVAMLKYKEKMIGKIKRVLDYFRENKEKAALIWRPHPLLEATLESMHPELLDSYRTLTAEYIKEGWGIYDTSPNLDLVLKLSDGYYGDSSSVVSLCREIDIPVLLQDADK